MFVVWGIGVKVCYKWFFESIVFEVFWGVDGICLGGGGVW